MLNHVAFPLSWYIVLLILFWIWFANILHRIICIICSHSGPVLKNVKKKKSVENCPSHELGGLLKGHMAEGNRISKYSWDWWPSPLPKLYTLHFRGVTLSCSASGIGQDNWNMWRIWGLVNLILEVLKTCSVISVKGHRGQRDKRRNAGDIQISEWALSSWEWI